MLLNPAFAVCPGKILEGGSLKDVAPLLFRACRRILPLMSLAPPFNIIIGGKWGRSNRSETQAPARRIAPNGLESLLNRSRIAPESLRPNAAFLCPKGTTSRTQPKKTARHFYQQKTGLPGAPESRLSGLPGVSA